MPPGTAPAGRSETTRPAGRAWQTERNGSEPFGTKRNHSQPLGTVANEKERSGTKWDRRECPRIHVTCVADISYRHADGNRGEFSAIVPRACSDYSDLSPRQPAHRRPQAFIRSRTPGHPQPASPGAAAPRASHRRRDVLRDPPADLDFSKSHTRRCAVIYQHNTPAPHRQAENRPTRAPRGRKEHGEGNAEDEMGTGDKGTGNQEPGTRSKEPGTGNLEQGTSKQRRAYISRGVPWSPRSGGHANERAACAAPGGRQEGTGIREKEPGTGNREQRTWNKEAANSGAHT